MIKKFCSITIIIGVLNLTSCASTVQESHYFIPNKAHPPVGFSRIYIYNPYNKYEDFTDPIIFIDNQEITLLPGNTYTTLLVSSGAHIWGILYKSTEQVIFSIPKPKHIDTFMINDRKSYFLKFSRKLDTETVIGVSGKGYPVPETRNRSYKSKLTIISNLKNAKGIYRCRYVIPTKNKIGKIIK